VLVHGGIPAIERLLFSASAAVLSVALILTESRSGFVAAILGCAVVAVCGRRWSRIAFAVAALLVVAVVAASPHLRDLLLVRGASYRPELWSAYLAMGMERPFAGVGLLANIDRPMSDGYVVDQPHNLVLAGFVRGGIAGALAMLAMIGVGIYQAARYWRATRNAIPLALIVTMFGYGMLDYQLLATYPAWPWITFWFPIGVCVGVETLLRTGAAPAAETGRP
jgi:O-antigen ligase